MYLGEDPLHASLELRELQEQIRDQKCVRVQLAHRARAEQPVELREQLVVQQSSEDASSDGEDLSISRSSKSIERL